MIERIENPTESFLSQIGMKGQIDRHPHLLCGQLATQREGEIKSVAGRIAIGMVS